MTDQLGFTLLITMMKYDRRYLWWQMNYLVDPLHWHLWMGFFRIFIFKVWNFLKFNLTLFFDCEIISVWFWEKNLGKKFKFIKTMNFKTEQNIIWHWFWIWNYCHLVYDGKKWALMEKRVFGMLDCFLFEIKWKELEGLMWQMKLF